MSRYSINIICILAAVFGVAFGIFGMLQSAPVTTVAPVVETQTSANTPPDNNAPLERQGTKEQLGPDTVNESHVPSQPRIAPPADTPETTLAVPEKHTGRIIGQVVDQLGEPLKGIPISGINYGVIRAARLDWQADVNDIRTSLETTLATLDEAVQKTRTDEQGRFELSGLDSERHYSVIVDGAVYGTKEYREVATGTELLVVLNTTARMTLRVYGPDGEPVSHIVLFKDGPGNSSSEDKRSHDGVYYLLLPDDSSRVFHDYDRFRIGAPGYVMSREYLFSDVGRELEVVVQRAPLLTGSVLGRNDKPLAEALVTVKSGTDTYGNALDIDSLVRDPMVSTDTMGRFRIDWMPPGTYALIFRLGRMDVQTARELEVALSEDREIEVQLDTGAHLQLRVTDAGGKPIVNARVGLTDENGNRFGRIDTGMPGEFHVIGLSSSKLNLEVSARSFMSFTEEIDTSTGDVTLDVVLHQGADIKGHIVNADGKAVEGVQMRWTSPRDEKGETSQIWRSPFGKTGHYHLAPLRPGDWTVDFFAHGRLDEPVLTKIVHVVPGEMTHDLVLESPRTLEATISLPAGADDFDGFVYLHLLSDEGNAYMLNVHAEGRNASIVAPFLPIGRYTVFARSDLLASSKSEVWLSSGTIACNLELTPPNCFEITRLSEHQLAENDGLRAGDYILRYNGQAITSERLLHKLTRATKGQTEVPMTIVRDGTEKEIKVRGGLLDISLAPVKR